MDLGTRRTLVEVLEDKGEFDELYNPILTRIGSFYADIFQPSPKDAIATGQVANVQYLQVNFLASDARRLALTSINKLRIGGVIWEINTAPYQAHYGNRLYARLDVSRKSDNGE